MSGPRAGSATEERQDRHADRDGQHSEVDDPVERRGGERVRTDRRSTAGTAREGARLARDEARGERQSVHEELLLIVASKGRVELVKKSRKYSRLDILSYFVYSVNYQRIEIMAF